MESIIFSFIFIISAVSGAPSAAPSSAAPPPSSLVLVTAPLSGNASNAANSSVAPPTVAVNASSLLLQDQDHHNQSHDNNAETSGDVQQGFVTQEGDVLIPNERNAVFNLWSDALVFYEMNKDFYDREADILAAMNMITSVSCIRFRKRTNQLNYITFRSGGGCASFVGCHGGSQPVFFGPSCSVGNICHELIHALGFHHEHTRMDRDQFIAVHWDHIQPGKEGNFKKKSGDTQNLPYDLESIMHYGKFFFSSGNHPTLEAWHGGDQMGQRKHLSTLDAERLNALYRCEDREKFQKDSGRKI